MSTRTGIPVFAVIGHPNEGKSSVVSTLSEDDSVRITPFPGETVICHPYPVIIDGEEVIRFIDTPGFQSPRKTLAWFKANEDAADPVRQFRKTNCNDPDFRDECELLGPVEEGAGIIYVLDGSRPVRSDDKAEMEVLRMTGQPRMAVINNKDKEEVFLEDWKSELRRHFNVVRIFNAHRATYKARIELLESLKAIDPDWQVALETVISSFKADWQRRNALTAELITEMLIRCVRFKVTQKYDEQTELEAARRKTLASYNETIAEMEKAAHRRIRKRFKHNIFNPDLPPRSIVHQGLFDEQTWKVLGLKPTQLAIAAGVAGGIMGSVLDAAAAGVSFGVFTAIGGIVGAGSVLLGGSKMADMKISGIRIGGFEVQIGPMENPQFMYVLIDRALIFYSHIINWAHGRRGLADHPDDAPVLIDGKAGYTAFWKDAERKICFRFFKQVRQGSIDSDTMEKQAFLNLIRSELDKISTQNLP